MTVSAIRRVSGAYASAKSNGRPAKKSFGFHRPVAVFIIGVRGRDAGFRKDGKLSIWTTTGRKRISYEIPKAFQKTFDNAVEYDSLTVIERNGKLIGRLCVTLEVPEPSGVLPVGIDLNETNALVANDTENRILFISGKKEKIANKKTRRLRKRLQRRLASHKTQNKDTHSVRRLLKRLGRKQSNRTKNFCRKTAKKLLNWIKPNSMLVFERLKKIKRPTKKSHCSKPTRRRLTSWAFAMLRKAIEDKAQELGVTTTDVDPSFTSQTCSNCGNFGNRRRHEFSCPHCNYEEHADVNAAKNIRLRYAVSRKTDGGLQVGQP